MLSHWEVELFVKAAQSNLFWLIQGVTSSKGFVKKCNNYPSDSR